MSFAPDSPSQDFNAMLAAAAERSRQSGAAQQGDAERGGGQNIRDILEPDLSVEGGGMLDINQALRQSTAAPVEEPIAPAPVAAPQPPQPAYPAERIPARADDGRFASPQPQQQPSPFGQDPEVDLSRPEPPTDLFSRLAPAPEPAPAPATPAAPTPDETFDRLVQSRGWQNLSPEERERQIARSYVELEQLDGRRSQEVAQLRDMVSRLEAQVQYAQPQPAAPAFEVDREAIENALERDPARFAAGLYQAEHPAYDEFIDAWAERQPGQATRFLSALHAAEAEERVRAEYEPYVMGNVEERAAAEGRAKFAGAWTEFAGERPEINDPGITAVIKADLEANPGLLSPIQLGHPNAERTVIESLYARAMMRGAAPAPAAPAPAPAPAQPQLTPEQLEQLRADRVAATIARSSAVAPLGGQGPGGGEEDPSSQIKAQILGHHRGTSIREGLTIDGRRL